MKYILSLLLLLATVCGWSQTTKQEVLQDLNRTGGVYYAYPGPQSTLTPTPKGYEPVYVSHYGRHGSRYLISDKDYSRVADLLRDAKEHNALTPLGENVLARLDTVLLETEGHSQELTSLGVHQHKGIAARMAKNFPEVFNTKGAKISARSTLVPRCILSMAAFTEGLKELNPSLDVKREASEKYMRYLNYHSPDHGTYTIDGKWKEQYRKFKDAHTNSQRLTSSLFSDPKYVEVNVNPDDLMWGVYWIASDMQNIDTPISFYDIFTPDELFDLWQCFNYNFYVNDGAFGGNGDKVIANAYPQVANIIESADVALKSGQPTADLRFGHDGNLVPLAAALHLKDCDNVVYNPDEFYTAFTDWKIAPMAGNIQIIFYRNKKKPDDILVKFLLNENEVGIPLETKTYPYYPWSEVREYYLNQISK